jgi:hypothetical protein
MSYRKLLILALTLAAAFQTLPSAASELTLTPGIRIAEEYNDNIFTTRENKETDWITHVNPSLRADYHASRLNLGLLYAPEYLKFAHNSSQDRLNHYLITSAKLTLLENRLFIKASDNYSRVTANVAQDIASTGGYDNQFSQNVFSISPYLEFRPDSQTLLTTGYFYNNWSYGRNTAIDKDENGLFLTVDREISRRTFLVADARSSYVTPDNNEDFSRTTLSVGIKREYAARSFANLMGGYTFFNYRGGRSTSSPFWAAGLKHEFGATTASFNAGVSYDSDAFRSSSEDRYASARLENRTGRGVAAIFASYHEFLDNFSGDTYARRLGGGASYLYNFTTNFSGNVGITADKFNIGGTTYGLPYFTTESVGIKYAFPYDLTAALTYSHLTWSNELWSGNDRIETNRVILELVMTFPSLHTTF